MPRSFLDALPTEVLPCGDPRCSEPTTCYTQITASGPSSIMPRSISRSGPDCKSKQTGKTSYMEVHETVEWPRKPLREAVHHPLLHCLHELFEEQAERTPEAVAVVFGGNQLTYRELNTRANQLAHYLQRLGVGPETLVGLFVERSF